MAERTAITRRVESTALIGLVALVCLLPLRRDVTWVDYSLYSAIGVLLGIMMLLRPRFAGLAGFVGGVGFIVLVTIAAWFREGFSSGVTSSAYALAVVVAGLSWGPGKTLLFALLSSVAVAILVRYAPVPAHAPLRSWGEVTAILVTLSLFVELAMSALNARIAEAQSSRRRFAQLFDGSPDALILVDAQRRIQLLNQAARQLLREPAEIGDSLDGFPPFRGAPATVMQALGGRLASAEQAPNGLLDEPLLSLAQGRYHEITATALSPEPELEDKLRLLTIRDITERVSHTRARQEFEAQLTNSKSLESLGRLAGGVAHDFNNLLTVILGTTDLVLATTRLDERAQAHLASVQSAAERAAELTAQLLAFGRKQVLEPAVFCPNTSLVHLRPLFERLIPESIALQVSVTPELGRARIDAARLEQVLVNLVTNACDAMPEGGTLRIATTNRTISEADALSAPVLDGEVFVPGPYVSLTVSDTGTGMDDATRAQIFEPFFTTKAVGKGTGLGLATVFGVVRQSGGHIFVTSKLGEGSSFELLFPRVHTVAPSSEVRVEQSPGADALEPLKILLVEDNAAVRNSVCAMLEVAGHQVLQANNGQEAWELIERRETAFDLLLTDVVMPNLNGPELARALRAEQPNARVLFMTGYSEGALAHDAGLNGVAVDGSAYLPKPFTKSMLDIKLTEMFAGAERRKGPSQPLCAEV